MTKKEREKQKQDAKEMLLKWIRPNSRILSVTRRYSPNSLSRSIDLYCLWEKPTQATPTLHYLSGFVSHLMGMRQDKNGALITTDDAEQLVIHLSYALFGIEKGKQLYNERI